jgi:hypothetical protein
LLSRQTGNRPEAAAQQLPHDIHPEIRLAFGNILTIFTPRLGYVCLNKGTSCRKAWFAKSPA